MNYLQTIITRIKIDWKEWIAFNQSQWNIRRDKKAIERAIKRARMKNLSDGRTYYILKNVGGGFDEVNSNDLRNLRAKKIKYFPRYQDYHTMLTECFAVVTSNNVIRNSYIETVQNMDFYKNLNNQNEKS
jgi:hypothetical protein